MKLVKRVAPLVLLVAIVNVALFPTKNARAENESPNNMILIPAGSYPMGSDYGDKDEQPIHEVFVDAFYIDKYEVTNREFKRFVESNPQWSKEKIPAKYSDGEYLKLWENGTYRPELANHPVVYISWYAADAYAKWIGKGLPSEIQWEKAASFNLINNNMKKNYKYKWAVGDVIDPYLANTAHYHGLAVGGYWPDWWGSFKQELDRKMSMGKITAEIGHFPPGVNGIYDMTGNVSEWCMDWYEGDAYERKKESSVKSSPKAESEDKGFNLLYEPSGIKDKGSFSGSYRITRGGAWSDEAKACRVANRYKMRPGFCSDEIGFRCVKSVKK